MTFTYGGDPSNSTLEEIRFLIGDTDSTDALLSDEEITYIITQAPNTYFAAAMAADMVVSKYGKYVQRSVGSLSINLGDRATNYEKLSKRLRRIGIKKGNASPILTNELTDHIFEKQMHDNPGTATDYSNTDLVTGSVLDGGDP